MPERYRKPSNMVFPIFAAMRDKKWVKMKIRKSNERGHADHVWLKSLHTFSFADYYDAEQIGFRTLRVINEDRIAPGMGFGTHQHHDMEIFSYVLEGGLEHKDSIGNRRILRPGQVQLMSAGSGVTHSEFNPSRTEAAHFLQIWIHPRDRNLTPSYTEWQPQPKHDSAARVLIISPDGRDNSAVIHQDAAVWRVRLQPGESITHELAAGRGAWLQVMRGSLKVGDTPLATGDAASTEDPGTLNISATESAEALLFDLK